MLVQRRTYRCNDAVRHRSIDLTRYFNKPGMKVELFGLPGKIKWINRNAVPAQPRSRIERVKAERFGGSRPNHFPDVDSHAQCQQFQLVYQSDIHASVDILQEFGHLRDV